jgi:hypothetical protein
MYVFALALLFGLGILAIERFVDRWLTRVPEAWAVLGVALGVALAWIVNFDIFRDWGLDARAGWLGVTMTGIILGGIADFWHFMLGLFSEVMRKVKGEARQMEETQLRVAS